MSSLQISLTACMHWPDTHVH